MTGYIKDYPRPQFVRSEWENLNGEWDFAFGDGAEDRRGGFSSDKKIKVPFTYETQASGIGEESFHRTVWYSRKIPKGKAGKKTIIHFEGSDYLTGVWVNGQFAGEHKGGYARFSFDVTSLLADGENILAVRVEDFNDTCQPRGKQRWEKENFGCWYVQTTGIWKTVWIEYVNPIYIENVKMTPDLDDASLAVEWKINTEEIPENLRLKAKISFDGYEITEASSSVKAQRGKLSVKIASEKLSSWGLMTWTPETPNLYDIRFTLETDGKETDSVSSYFGMREIEAKDGQILLNGRPYYQRLILDQGYWEKSGLTPPDEDAVKYDIDKTKELGFNGARKHQKVEDDRYYYWCDVKGLLVWCEMPSAYVYGDDMTASFMDEWQSIVKAHYNHPSIVTWTPINESWGIPQTAKDKTQQHFAQAVYHMTKAIDATRPVIVNDGWEHTVSDIVTLHDYEELGSVLSERYTKNKDKILNNTLWHNNHKRPFADGFKYNGQPIIISEYGGAAYSSKGAAQWGYGNSMKDENALLSRIDDVTTAIKKLPYVCGFCYTQLTDVQQEVNGLLTLSREEKADSGKIAEIFSRNVNPEY